MPIYVGEKVVRNYSAINAIPTSGLVCFLDAGVYDSYPGTGTKWYDLSGNGVHMNMSGSLTWSSDGYFTGFNTGNSFENSGSNWVSKLPAGSSDRTIVGIGKRVLNSQPLEHLASYGNGGSTNQVFSVNINTSGVVGDHRWGTFNIGTSTVASGRKALIASRWSSTYTYGRLSINTTHEFGAAIGAPATNNAEAFRIGRRLSTYSEQWGGDIYAVLIYSRALSDEEINNIYYHYNTNRMPSIGIT
jgi:hypothetical protein